MSNLKIDDPVVVNGKTVGKIKNINNNERDVLITMEIRERITLHKGYTVFNTDKGILGDQSIVIQTGDPKNAPVNVHDTLAGTFHPGISDVLGSAWKLKDLAVMYKKKAEEMLLGSEEKESFISAFSAVISEIETFSRKLYDAALVLDAGVSPGIDTLKSFTGNAQEFIREISAVIPEEITTVEKQVETVSTYIGKLDAIVTSLTDIVLKIKNSELIEKEQISSLLVQLNEIKKIIRDIQVGAFKLRLTIKAGF
jgi:ABC-type transporter Mla subunit MlaD